MSLTLKLDLLDTWGSHISIRQRGDTNTHICAHKSSQTHIIKWPIHSSVLESSFYRTEKVRTNVRDDSDICQVTIDPVFTTVFYSVINITVYYMFLHTINVNLTEVASPQHSPFLFVLGNLLLFVLTLQ